MKYIFYYDESEHSRKINYKTITADNYYDSFITVIVGWSTENEAEIARKYAAFEEKYVDRKSHGELKSKTIKQNQLQYGFASLNEENVNLLNDFLSLFSEEIFMYFSITSKIEFVIAQLFENYHNTIFWNMDALKYSITKAILTYKPQEILYSIYNNPDELIDLLKAFLKRKIEQNKANPSLKARENPAFGQILTLLNDVQPIETIKWSYDTAFLGFNKYLQNKAITNYALIIDREGNYENTATAACKVGLINVMEKDSLNTFGIRMADMLAGLISKLLKSMYSSLHAQSLAEQTSKNILETQWFMVNNSQLNLYKKMHYVISVLNHDWHKSYSGIYADDLITLIALLKFMNHFNDVEEIKKRNINMQGESFNTYACGCLDDYFTSMTNKLPIEFIQNASDDYFLNQRGAKVFFDINRQSALKFTNNKCICNVLSVGVSKEGVPLVTVAEKGEVNCYRIPVELREWAMSAVGFANMGTNIFPSEVLFSKYKGKYYADIL